MSKPETTPTENELAEALRQLLNNIPQNGSVWPQAIMDGQTALAHYDNRRKA